MLNYPVPNRLSHELNQEKKSQEKMVHAGLLHRLGRVLRVRTRQIFFFFFFSFSEGGVGYTAIEVCYHRSSICKFVLTHTK